MRNHCDLASPRRAPTWLLRELREIDPAYDCHYVGNGHWMIGRVVRNRDRIEIAGKMHYGRDRKHDGWRYGSFARVAVPVLGMQGFGCVKLFQIQGEPDRRIITEARRREWLYRNQREQEFAAALERSEGLADLRNSDQNMMRSDRWWDELEYRETHATPELFRGRKHVRYGASA